MTTKLTKKLTVIKNAISMLKDYYIPPFTPYKIIVDQNIMYSVLKKYLPNFEDNIWLPLDGKFAITTLEDMRKIIEWDWTDVKRYISEVFDCEDFAMYFKSRVALAFGINSVAYVLDYSSAHSYNLLVIKENAELKVYVYEPQTDEIFEINERDRRFYALEFYVVLI